MGLLDKRMKEENEKRVLWYYIKFFSMLYMNRSVKGAFFYLKRSLVEMNSTFERCLKACSHFNSLIKAVLF